LWQQQMTITVDGRKKQKCFYGKTKAEVLKKIAAFREEQEKGRSFEDVADEWWEQHEKDIEANSAKPYRPALRRAKERFGKEDIRNIKPLDINRFIYQYVEEKHAALKTAKTQLMIISLICKYAAANGYIDSNPAREVSVPRNLPKTKRDIASDDDIKRVKNSTSCTFGMFAFWILYTGCRRGELMALTWNDVDIKNRTISITKSLYHENGIPKTKEPKTAAGKRDVPLMNKLLEKIQPKRGLIFSGEKGGLMRNYDFQKLWGLYVSESGVTCTPHQLRHAYATMLFENDISESDAQELLGHAYIQTTKDIYTHIRDSRKEQIKSKLLDVDLI